MSNLIDEIIKQSEERIDHSMEAGWTGGFAPEYYNQWLRKVLTDNFETNVSSTYVPTINISKKD